jgi:hypothetical protein
VGKYSLKATIVEEEEGACFPIGAAEALIGEGTVGVHVTGDSPVEQSVKSAVYDEFYSPRDEAECGGSAAKERSTS